MKKILLAITALVVALSANADTKTFAISADSYLGSYYEGTAVEAPLTDILTAIGATSMDDVTIYSEETSGTRTSSVRGTTDGWRDASGNFVSWGSSAYFYVQDDASLPGAKYYLGGMQGNTGNVASYTAKLVYVNNTTSAEAILNVTLNYVEAPEVKITTVATIDGPTIEYEATDAEYTEKTIHLTGEQLSEIYTALNISDLESAYVYGYNPSTEEYLIDYSSYDGWRNADGDFASWSGSVTVPYCVKVYNYGYDFKCYNVTVDSEMSGYCYWAFVNSNNEAVLVKIKFSYLAPPTVKSTIDASVNYFSDEASYTEKVVSLSEEQISNICTTLGISTLEEGTVYGYNPTTEKFITAYAYYDGWRNADGDFAAWAGNISVPYCVKVYDDGANYYCYNLTVNSEMSADCYWAIANSNNEAVLVKVNFHYIAYPSVAMNSNGYATYSSAYDVAITSGLDVKAYKAAINEDDIELTELTRYIPAGTGVLLYSATGTTATFNTPAADATAADVTDNCLVPTTTADTPVADFESAWVLGDANLFLKYTGTAFIANRAYIPTSSHSEAKALSISSADDATAIAKVNDSIANSANYNLAGQRVNANAKGFVIKDGKKFFNK